LLHPLITVRHLIAAFKEPSSLASKRQSTQSEDAIRA